MNFIFADFAVLQLAHQCGGTQADLVHAVAPVDHDGMLGTQTLQCTHLDTHQIGVKHTHQNIGRASRVGQRPQDIEDGAYAQLFAHRCHIFHGRVVVGCKHEANALLGQAL